MINFLDIIGDWNPQLLRELRGRLKPRNVLITVNVSLLGQLLLFLYSSSKLPSDIPNPNKYWNPIHNQYCAEPTPTNDPSLCIRYPVDPIAIDWQVFWHNLFMALCWISIFTLLVLGTFLIISDLSREERRGTLNFLRLSPLSELKIMSGKLLGVPILLYLAVILAVPLHLWAGLSAEIPLLRIFLFYLVVASSCIFFYSGALLLGSSISNWSWLLPWLGSGIVIAFLMLTKDLIDSSPDEQLTWLRLLGPIHPMLYLFYPCQGHCCHGVCETGFWDWINWQWYYFRVGQSMFSLVGFVLLQHGLWTYWIWQGFKRRFRNPNTTIISKGQSYLLVACFEVVIVGCSVFERWFLGSGRPNRHIHCLAVVNSIMLFVLMVTLSPSRQTLLDWVHSRRERASHPQGFRKNTLVSDLIWGEKSPAIVAMAINIAIAVSPLIIGSLLGILEAFEKTEMLFLGAFFVSLMMVYATIIQLILMMKTSRPSLWVIGTIVALVLLLPKTLAILGMHHLQYIILWLFSTFPSKIISYVVYREMDTMRMNTMFLALFGQLTIVTLLNLQLRRQLKLASESASKAILKRYPSFPTN
ncbi:MAG: ABC transporter permease [Symploca sp. SIO3C6]|nr:ABC transporter permease [Symploca sp. SIO3C6]